MKFYLCLALELLTITFIVVVAFLTFFALVGWAELHF
jgi:hypothetical protein